LNKAFEEALKLVDKEINELIAKSLDYKENEIIMQESAVSPEGNIGDDIAKTVINVYNQMKSKYEKVEQFIEISEVENYQLVNQEKGKNQTLFREIDKIWVYPTPEGSSFRLAVAAKFKINREEKKTGSISINVLPIDAEVVLKRDDGENYTFKGSKDFNKTPIGKYSLVIKANGYTTKTESFNLNKDDIIKKQVELEKISSIPTNGLVAYYPFNGNANDESGNNNNGTVNGATLTTDRNGNSNSAYSFDGKNDVIDYNYSPMNNTDNFAIACWINFSATYQNGTPILLGVDDGIGGKSYLNGIELYIGNYVSDGDVLSIGVSDIQWVSSNYRINSINKWYFIVIQRRNSSYLISVNGTEILNRNGNSPRPPTDLKIGSATNCRFFKGEIDDIRIYNRPLDENDILTLYKESK